MRTNCLDLGRGFRMTIVMWALLGVLLLAVVLLAWLLAQVLETARASAAPNRGSRASTSAPRRPRAIQPAAGSACDGFPALPAAGSRGEDVGLEDFDACPPRPLEPRVRVLQGDRGRPRPASKVDLHRQKTELSFSSATHPESNRALLEAYGLDCPALLQPDGGTIKFAQWERRPPTSWTTAPDREAGCRRRA